MQFRLYLNGLFHGCLLHFVKVMLHETIRNDDFKRNTALQHCCDILSNGYNIVPTLQRCVQCAKNRRCESSHVASPLNPSGDHL